MIPIESKYPVIRKALSDVVSRPKGKEMASGNLPSIWRCTHINALASYACAPVSPLARQSPAPDSISGEGRILPATALIAIGNPIVESDSKALELLTALNRCFCQYPVCCLSLDGGFSWIHQVLRNHGRIVILDTVAATSEGLEEDCLAVDLTKEVLGLSGQTIRSSHGLSWLDEVKLFLLDSPLPENLIFFGVKEGSIGSTGATEAQGDGYLDSSLTKPLAKLVGIVESMVCDKAGNTGAQHIGEADA